MDHYLPRGRPTVRPPPDRRRRGGACSISTCSAPCSRGPGEAPDRRAAARRLAQVLRAARLGARRRRSPHRARRPAPRRRRRCSTSPTTRPASSTASSTPPSTPHWQAEGHAALEIQTSHGGSGSPGARGDRRARGAGGDAGARQRHRRHRREVGQDPGRLAGASCRTTRRPTPRPSCSWCARATRRALEDWDDLVARRRPGDHPEPEDLGRRALELPRRLGLGRQAVRRQRGRRSASFMARALRQRARARHRRARLDHHLRAARHRRRAARLGERGATWRSRSSARTSSTSSCRRSRSWPSRRWRWSRATSSPTSSAQAAQAYLELPLQPRGPGASR